MMNDLNKLIAQTLGIEHITIEYDAYEHFKTNDPYYGFGKWITFLDAGEVMGETFPQDWENDLNAAMPLFIELPEVSEITIDRPLKQWEVGYADDEFHGGKMGDLSSKALARAICETWLRWKGVDLDEEVQP